MGKAKGFSANSDDACSDGDMVSMGPSFGDLRPFVRHHPDHKLETGIAKLVPAEQVPSDPSKSLQLRHRCGNLYDVIPPPESTTSTKGPPNVNSEAFRAGWDTIFGKKIPVGQA